MSLASPPPADRRARGSEQEASRDRAPGSIRACVRGSGAALPARVVSNAETGDEGRHLGRMDRAAHRHPPAVCRRARRNHIVAGRSRRLRRRCAAAASRRPTSTSSSSPRRRPITRFPRSRPRFRPRSASSRGPLSTCRRSAAASSCGRYGGEIPAFRLEQARARDRRGDVFATPGLERPHDLRPVRRRGGSDRARGARQRRPARLARRDRLAPARGRPASREALRRRRRRRPAGRLAICGWKARKCSATRSAW